MEDKVNISMITYNRLNYTKQSIQSLLENTNYPYVITVVDNNSTDGTKDYLKDLYNKKLIKNLILLDKNIGVAKASNLGWQMENFNYYLKFDNDMVILKSNWLNDLVKVVNDVPDIGAIGYSVEQVRYQLLEVKGYKLQLNSSIGGACFLIPERTRLKVGYWCEDFREYGEEDAEYGWRIRHFGLHNIYMEDMSTLKHLEDNSDSNYRQFKDSCRRDNMHSFWRIANSNYRFIAPKSKLEDYKNYIYRE